MQQNQSINEALRIIQEELTAQYSVNGDLALRGLQAEAKGDRQHAAVLYAQSSHPIAISRNQLLRQAHPESFTQINIHISSSSPSLLSFLPQSLLGSLFPRNQLPINSPITAAEKSPEIVRPVAAPLPQPFEKKSNQPLAHANKQKPRKYDFNKFSEADIQQCIAEMNEREKTILKNIFEETKNHSENTTIDVFSKIHEIKKATLKSLIGTLSEKSLLIRWPILSSFGRKVVDALCNKKVAEVSNNPPKISKSKNYDHDNFSTQDIINCIREMKPDEQTTLLNIQQHPGEKVAYSKVYDVKIKTLNAIIRRLSNKSLVTRWPVLSKFGNQVVKVLRIRNERAMSATQTPTTKMATLAPTFTPLQQLAKVCAKQSQIQETQTTTSSMSSDAKRSNIHSLLN